MKNNQSKKEKGFTLVEILVVVAIIGMASIALTMTARSMVISNLRLRYVNNIHTKTQEFSQYFIKVARMSSSRSKDQLQTIDPNHPIINTDGYNLNDLTPGPINNTNKLLIVWRKPINDLNYKNTALLFDIDTIRTHFKDMTVSDLEFRGGGFNDVNKVTLYYKVTAGPNQGNLNDPLTVTIPVQMTVSFRDF